MKLGLGLYRHMLTTDNFPFARQAGMAYALGYMRAALTLIGAD